MACGSEGGLDEGKRGGVLSEQWQFVNRDYPFTGQHGEMVCAEWTRRDEATGRTMVEREFYHPAELDRMFTGGLGIDRAALQAVRAGGVTTVATCEGARRFIALKQEHLESLPSTAPDPSAMKGVAPPIPGLSEADDEDERVDKVAQGVSWSALGAEVAIWIWGGSEWGICSGVVINKTTILTAAHCFPANGSYKVWVDHGIGTPCIIQYCADPPTVNKITSGDLVVGIFANFQYNDDPGWCPQPGNKFRYTRVETKLGWIMSIIGTCNQYTQSGNGWKYRRCW